LLVSASQSWRRGSNLLWKPW